MIPEPQGLETLQDDAGLKEMLLPRHKPYVVIPEPDRGTRGLASMMRNARHVLL